MLERGQPVRIFQMDLNKIFEEIPFDCAEYYLDAFRAVSIALFYQMLVPQGIIFCVLELLLHYVVQRYVLLKRSAPPIELDFKFIISMIYIFDFCLFINGMGYMILEWGLNEQKQWFSTTMICMVVF